MLQAKVQRGVTDTTTWADKQATHRVLVLLVCCPPESKGSICTALKEVLTAACWAYAELTCLLQQLYKYSCLLYVLIRLLTLLHVPKASENDCCAQRACCWCCTYSHTGLMSDEFNCTAPACDLLSSWSSSELMTCDLVAHDLMNNDLQRARLQA